MVYCTEKVVFLLHIRKSVQRKLFRLKNTGMGEEMKTERKRGKIFIVITVVAAFAVLVGFFSNTVAFERMMGKIV